MVPRDWKLHSVSEICKLQNGNSFKPHQWDTKGLPIIRIQNLNGSEKFNYFSGEPDERWLVEPGQLLFSWAGTKGVSFGPTIWKGERGVLNQHIYKVFANDGVDSDWLFLALRHVTARIEAQAHGFKATLLHVKKNDIDGQLVPVPPIEEQQRISKIISTWDKAIETAEKLIENSRTQKKALMQQLLSGKKRLPGFNKPWRDVRFNKVFERVTRKNSVGNDNVLTISGQHGLVNQRDYFNKSVASDNLAGYTLLERGDFAYNKSYSKGYPMGAIKPLTKYDHGVVSSLYICFRLKDSRPSSQEFFRHYFEAGIFNREIYAIAQEGARNHGLLNVSVTDFFKAKLHIPEPDENEAIEKVISTAEQELNNLEAQLESLKSQKRALMQQLLTGKRRVKVDSPEAATA